MGRRRRAARVGVVVTQRSPEAQKARAAAFNASYPVGTRVRCWDDAERTTYVDDVVCEPGAFVFFGGDDAVVKVEHGWRALDFVEVLS